MSCHLKDLAASSVAPAWPMAGDTLSAVAALRTTSTYSPTGDQPQAIAKLADGILAGEQFQTLVGATGTGKTATMPWPTEKANQPPPGIAHTKTPRPKLANSS